MRKDGTVLWAELRVSLVRTPEGGDPFYFVSVVEEAAAAPLAGAAGDLGAAALFAGPGEMRARCRALDWAATPLGPAAGWSHSLRTIAAVVLGSRQPMFLFWGPELVQLYNDAYRPSLGATSADGMAGHDRHPRALGARGREFWTEIWDVIGPQIAQVMGGGEATWPEDQLVPI